MSERMYNVCYVCTCVYMNLHGMNIHIYIYIFKYVYNVMYS